MKKPKGRPSETLEIPVLENDIRIFLNSDDTVIHTTAGRPRKNEIEVNILEFLRTNTNSTTSDICRGLGRDSVSSWASVNRILIRLFEDGFVVAKSQGRKKYWAKTDKEWSEKENENPEKDSRGDKKYKYDLYLGNFLSTDKWAFKEEIPAGRGTYLKTKYYPRSALVLIGDFKVSRKYLNVPAGTVMFYTSMSELGILSSIGEEYAGQAVTIIVNPPDPETVGVYKETEIYYIKSGRCYGKTALMENTDSN